MPLECCIIDDLYNLCMDAFYTSVVKKVSTQAIFVDVFVSKDKFLDRFYSSYSNYTCIYEGCSKRIAYCVVARYSRGT